MTIPGGELGISSSSSVARLIVTGHHDMFPLASNFFRSALYVYSEMGRCETNVFIFSAFVSHSHLHHCWFTSRVEVGDLLTKPAQ